MRALDAALGAPWAMLPGRLEELLTIAAREHEVTPQALEAYRAKTVTQAEVLEERDGVAVLNVIGPLFRRANLFTEFSGAISYDILRRDLQIAVDDPSFKSILLNVDSPGGDANGCDELAKAIAAARAVKPVIAYVGGTAASGGYWLASAASEIVVADGAMLGSIGVLISMRDTKARDEAGGVRRFDFVSSQSPLKRLDPATRGGESEVQRIADDLAEVFVSAVAQNRGVTTEHVLARFGSGSMLIGAKAIEAGMADRLGSFEGTLATMQTSVRTPGRSPQRSVKGFIMSETNRPQAGADDIDALKTENERLRTEASVAGPAAKARIKAIMTSPEAKGREEQAEHLAYETDMTADAAVRILAKAPKPTAATPVQEDAALLEQRRLNGEGLGGKPAPAPTAKAVDLSAVMNKQLAKEGL